MLAALADHEDEIAELCRRHFVRRLEVFGSAAREHDFDPARSDVDFLVEFAPTSDLAPLHQFMGLAQSLHDLLGRPVDLVEAGAVKNPYFQAGIDRTRRLVYGP